MLPSIFQMKFNQGYIHDCFKLQKGSCRNNLQLALQSRELGSSSGVVTKIVWMFPTKILFIFTSLQLVLQMWAVWKQICLQLTAVKLWAYCFKWNVQLHKSFFYFSKSNPPQINQRKCFLGPHQSLFICRTPDIPSQWEEFTLFAGQRQCSWSKKENQLSKHGRC